MQREFTIGGVRLEAAWHGAPPDKAVTLVLLHEGLGCVAMWRDFPQKLAERTGLGVLVWSRAGYGGSDPVVLPRPLTYMHDEALHGLPALLDAAGVESAILVGHSDGASIATIYAGSRQDFRVHALVLIAPHFFVEDVSIDSIAAARRAYENGDLRAKLARYHGANVDNAFRGWNDAWLDPAFRAWRIDDAVAHVRVPILVIQGRDDQYGTLAQVQLVQEDAYCPVETLIVERCGHAPHIEQQDAALAAIAAFVRRVEALHAGAPLPAEAG